MQAECDPIYRYSLYSYRIILYIRYSGNRSLGSDSLVNKELQKIYIYIFIQAKHMVCIMMLHY